MNPTRWQRLKTRFEKAVDLTAVRLHKYLADITGTGTRQELQKLVGDGDGQEGFLEQPAFALKAGDATMTLRCLAAGELIADRFQIVRFIGHGGMGDVYEAEDTAQSRKPRVALKTIRPEIAANPRIVRQFEREIELGKTVTHVNVCRVYDLGLHRDPPLMFLTMELLDGETLAHRLGRVGRMQPSEALPLLKQLCEGLNAAHEAHVVHRDLKPGNIMLVPLREGSDLRVVITDFGLARDASGPGEAAAVTDLGAGTPDYMSPEQVIGNPLTTRSDIYSLGVVAYRLVTGRLPFEGEPATVRMVKRLDEPPISPRAYIATLPRNWEAAILKCLARDPDKRFVSAREVITCLENGRPQRRIVWTRRKLSAAGVFAAVPAAFFGWRVWKRSANRLPADAERLYQQGVANIHAGAYFAAAKTLEQSIVLAPSFGPARARLAESWLELDLPEKAAREFLRIRRLDNSSLSVADRLEIEAVDLTLTREFQAAVTRYERIVKETPDALDLNIDLGRAYEKAGKLDQAIESYRRAAQATGHSPAAWLRLAVLYGQRGKAVESENAFSEADRGYRMGSNLEGLTEVTLQRGIAANRKGDFDRAAALLRKAHDLAQSAGNQQQEISAKLALANAAYAAGDAALSETYARESLETAQANKMDELTIRGFLNLGNAYLRKGDFTGAEKHLQDALALARRTDSGRLTAQSLFSLAALHDRMDRSEQQISEAREALEYYQRNRWVQQSFQCLTLIGRGESGAGKYTDALDSFQKLLTEAEKAGDKSQMAASRENLGNVLAAQEQFPRALSHYREFLRISNGERKGYASLHCAAMLWRLGDYQEAEIKLRDAETTGASFPQLLRSIARQRAEMLLSQKRWTDVVSLTQEEQSATSSNTPVRSVALTRMRGLAWWRSGNREAGRRECAKALSAAENMKDLETLFQARMAILETATGSHDVEQARAIFRNLESVLNVYPESRWRAYRLMARLEPQYQATASAARDDLLKQWGESDFRRYLTRPDILALSWHTSETNFAKQGRG